MNILVVLLIVILIVFALGGSWGYRQPWYTPAYGYGGGLIFVILLVVVILALMGRI